MSTENKPEAVEQEPGFVGYFAAEYMGGPVIYSQVNYSQKDEPNVYPLYTHAPDSAARIAELEMINAELLMALGGILNSSVTRIGTKQYMQAKAAIAKATGEQK